MKKLHRHTGIILVIFAVLLLAIGFFAHWTVSNVFSAFCLLLIIAGIILHVVFIKHDSNY